MICGHVGLLIVLAAGHAPGLAGQQVASEPDSAEAEPEGDAAEEPEGDGAQRTEINLLGETASDSGESRRNENVQFNLVDNNALKELGIRLGTTAIIINNHRRVCRQPGLFRPRIRKASDSPRARPAHSRRRLPFGSRLEPAQARPRRAGSPGACSEKPHSCATLSPGLNLPW